MVKLEKTLVIYKLFFVLSRILLYPPIFILFYNNKGLAFDQITMLKVIWFLSTFLLEMPSGFLADRWNKKNIVIFSCCTFSLSCFLNVFFNNFFVLCFSSALWGFSVAFLSGTDVAWLYNYLKKHGLEHDFAKISGEYTYYNQIATACSLFLSSFLFVHNNAFPYIINGLFFLSSAFIATLLPEEELMSSTTKTHSPFFLSEIRSNLISIRKLSKWYVYLASFTAITIFLFDTYQLKLRSIGFPVKYNGIIYAYFTVISGIAAKYSHLTTRIFSVRKMLVLLAFVQGVSLILLYFSEHLFFVLLMFSVHEIVFGAFSVLASTFINSVIESHQRAFNLSLMSFSSHIIKTFVFLVGGKCFVALKMQSFYLLLGGLFCSMAVCAFSFLKKNEE